MMRYDEGLFIQFCRSVPVVTLIQFGDAVAAGACFFSFCGQLLTDIHRRAGDGRYGNTTHRLQILRLLGIHLLDGCACAERENRCQTEGCDD